MEASVGDITESCEYTAPFSTNGTIQYVESIEELLREDRTSELDVPSYNKSYRSGYFVIYYTSYSNTVPVFITSLMSAIQAADTSLVGGLGFQRPRSNEQGAAEYHIYVLADGYGESAYCRSFGNNSGVRTSYIVFPGITDLSVEPDLFQQGAAAHEYMHAITHTYRANGELPGWFKEAWSNWAAVRVQGIASLNVFSVNKYFYTTHSDGWSSRPFISADYPLNGYPNNAYGGTVNPFAAHYREFAVPAEGRYPLDITIRLLDSYGSLSGRLHMNSSSGVVTNWNLTSESSFVTYSTTIGVSYTKGGISIINTDSSDQTSYHITIARS